VNQRAVNDQEYRGLAGVAAGQVVFAAVFVFLLLSAFHRPAPHALPVGVVAAPAIARQLQVALDAHEPGGFDCARIRTLRERAWRSSAETPTALLWPPQAVSVS
jgi:hypothetical protein